MVANGVSGAKQKMSELYAIYREEKPYAYRYGEEWEAMALMIDGGHKTPQEAFEAWLMEHRSRPFLP